jgi:hypothetical protein
MTTDWSTFSSEVKARHPMHGCKICKLLENVSEEDAKIIRAVLDDDENSSRSIRNGLRARGIRVAPESVVSHRRGECL